MRGTRGVKRPVGTVDAGLSRALATIALEIGPRTPELTEIAESTAERHPIAAHLNT